MLVDPAAPARPVLLYYGSKWRLAPWIISHFPAHDSYVEVCGGSGAVLLRKPPAALETFNDLDREVVNFFSVLRSRADELIEQIRLTPYARAEFDLCDICEGDDLERARRFFASAWMGIRCMPFSSSGWRSQSLSNEAYTLSIKQFENGKAELLRVADRFLAVQIENRPAEYVIDRYGMAPGALVYFDPPYVQSTRTSSNVYKFEVDQSFHVDCADLLRRSSAFVVVSGYASDLYRDIYEAYGWRRVDREAQVNAGATRIECLWLNPATVAALDSHDQLSLF